MLGPFLEVLIGGLLTGVLYSLVALGFVLIFKASGVFNFAQGAMVLFAALTLVRLMEVMPFGAGAGRGLPRSCWRSPSRSSAWCCATLVNQEGIILFMATIGITFFLDGFGQTRVGQRRLHARSRHAEGPDLPVRGRLRRRPAGRPSRPVWPP